MAIHAHPEPADPYNPADHSQQRSESVLHPSPFIPIRVPVFAPVLLLNDVIVKILSVSGRPMRPRGSSDAAEYAEEGAVRAANPQRFTPKIRKTD